MNVDLSKYQNNKYNPGKNFFIRFLWFYINLFFFNNSLLPFSGLKVFLLRLFGAKIGKGVVIKPSINIKYPWLLEIGNNVWIGENVWIDNLDNVKIGNNCVISQGALLLCGNHDFKKVSFDLITGFIVLEDGVWIGAKSVVTAGVRCKTHSVLSVASVASKDLEPYGIYRGNPATLIKTRTIQ